jgi:NADH-quinone oxidoreductase subunit N
MFFKDPVEDGTGVVIPSVYTQLTIVISSVITFALGIYPTPLINFIQSTASFLR